MKSKFDPRHLKRIKTMQAIFAWGFGDSVTSTGNSEKVISKIPEIDILISENAPKWPLDKINKVDLSILRCAFWELMFERDTPPKVVIDEAVELAKEYGTESSPSFINGVIGSAVKKLDLNLSAHQNNDSKDNSTQ